MTPATFDDLAATLDRLVTDWPAGLDACVAVVRSLAGSPALAARIAAELAAVAAVPTHIPVQTASLHHWVLWRSSRGASLTLSRVPTEPRDDADYLTDTAAHQIVVPCGDVPLQVDLYAQPAVGDPEVMTREHALTPRGTATVQPGDALVLRPREDVVDLAVPARPAYVLVFDGPRVLTQRWVYEKVTRRAVASIAASPHDARLEGGLRLLRVLGHTPAVPVMAALATHPAHFVRWTAIRYTAALDAATGVDLLRAAVHDPHPHVREAAARALERVEKG